MRCGELFKETCVVFREHTQILDLIFHDIYSYIKSVSYPNNKAKSLLGAAKMLVEEYNGEVPSDMAIRMPLMAKAIVPITSIMKRNVSSAFININPFYFPAYSNDTPA